MGKGQELLQQIQELIGKSSKWPVYIRLIFFSKHLDNHDRFLMVNFAYVNGLPLELLQQWMNLRGQLRDSSAKRHILELYTQYESGQYNDERKFPYYSFNVSQHEYQYINGKRRTGPIKTYDFEEPQQDASIKLYFYIIVNIILIDSILYKFYDF